MKYSSSSPALLMCLRYKQSNWWSNNFIQFNRLAWLGKKTCLLCSYFQVGELGRQNSRLVTALLMSSYYINFILARKLQASHFDIVMVIN